MNSYECFLQSIIDKKIIKLIFDSKDKGIIERYCIPFDFGLSRKYKDNLERYHLYDLDSPEGSHNLSILPEQIISIEITENYFDPSHYVKWTPNWIIKRNWGIYS
jgi:hypothetical protein